MAELTEEHDGLTKGPRLQLTYVSYHLNWPGMTRLPVYIYNPATNKMYGFRNPLPYSQRSINTVENRYVRWGSLMKGMEASKANAAELVLKALVDCMPTLEPVIIYTRQMHKKSSSNTLLTDSYIPLRTLLAFSMVCTCFPPMTELREAILSEFLEIYPESTCLACGFIRRNCDCENVTKINENKFFGYVTKKRDVELQTEIIEPPLLPPQETHGVPGMMPWQGGQYCPPPMSNPSMPMMVNVPSYSLAGQGESQLKIQVPHPMGGVFTVALPPGIKLQSGMRIPLHTILGGNLPPPNTTVVLPPSSLAALGLVCLDQTKRYVNPEQASHQVNQASPFTPVSSCPSTPSSKDYSPMVVTSKGLVPQTSVSTPPVGASPSGESTPSSVPPHPSYIPRPPKPATRSIFIQTDLALKGFTRKRTKKINEEEYGYVIKARVPKKDGEAKADEEKKDGEGAKEGETSTVEGKEAAKNGSPNKENKDPDKGTAEAGTSDQANTSKASEASSDKPVKKTMYKIWRLVEEDSSDDEDTPEKEPDKDTAKVGDEVKDKPADGESKTSTEKANEPMSDEKTQNSASQENGIVSGDAEVQGKEPVKTFGAASNAEAELVREMGEETHDRTAEEVSEEFNSKESSEVTGTDGGGEKMLPSSDKEVVKDMKEQKPKDEGCNINQEEAMEVEDTEMLNQSNSTVDSSRELMLLEEAKASKQAMEPTDELSAAVQESPGNLPEGKGVSGADRDTPMEGIRSEIQLTNTDSQLNKDVSPVKHGEGESKNSAALDCQETQSHDTDEVKTHCCEFCGMTFDTEEKLTMHFDYCEERKVEPVPSPKKRNEPTASPLELSQEASGSDEKEDNQSKPEQSSEKEEEPKEIEVTMTSLDLENKPTNCPLKLKRYFAKFEYMPTGEFIYKCTFTRCGQCFDTKKMAILHSKIHVLNTDAKYLWCYEEKCHYKVPFFRFYDLLRHMKMAHFITCTKETSDTHVCDLCALTFDTEEELVSHLDYHYNNRYKCIHCGTMLVTWHQVQTHLETCEDKGLNKRNIGCPYCQFVFHKRSIRNLHMHAHTDEGLMCPICRDKEVWEQWKSLRKHYQQKHMKLLESKVMIPYSLVCIC